MVVWVVRSLRGAEKVVLIEKIRSLHSLEREGCPDQIEDLTEDSRFSSRVGPLV